MQRRSVSLVDGRFQLDDYPGAAKVVAVRGHQEQHLADFQLHMHDLQQVLQWGESLGRISSELDPGPDFTIRRGLWYAMVVRFCKCFGGGNGRFPLDPKVVYQGHSASLTDYRYFDHLRDRNLVHDENTMSQAYILAVLNPPDRQPKVVDVVGLAVLQESFSKGDIAKLAPLVRRAEQWVHDAFDKASARLKADLEKLPYERLEALGSNIGYVLPDEGDASTPKPRVRRTDAQRGSSKRKRNKRK